MASITHSKPKQLDSRVLMKAKAGTQKKITTIKQKHISGYEQNSSPM